jgi:Raf kinase inhibitor-like YbhB/YbcL family protein
MAEQGFTLSSPHFRHGSPIPAEFTCDGQDLQPRLEWMHPPEGTRSYALIMIDPDAPKGTFTHWIRFNIPADRDHLTAGDPGVDGKNDFQGDGYGGPCPPPKHGKHRYFFRLYALDVDSLDLAPGARRDQLDAAMKGHLLGEAELMGVYERRPL